jgi:DUF971 family protein
VKTPSAIRVSTDKSTLSIHYAEGDSFSLSAEYLRVFSPSAEVRGHGRGQEVLQFGKRHVVISGLEKAGNYALRITFSDGHDSGIYSWSYLSELAENYTDYWIDYLSRLHEAGKSRDQDVQIVKLLD